MITSAGLLLYRTGPDGPQLLLGHMGGPFWARKDDGAWSIPKGEHDADEEPAHAAVREFTEELGSAPPDGPLVAEHIVPGTFELEWPPRSGRKQTFPEIDRAAWFDPDTARRKLVKAQTEFVDRLLESLGPAKLGE